jgi:molybdopterin converting factor small subunit
MVRLVLYGVLRTAAGRGEMEVDAKTAKEALKMASNLIGGQAPGLVFDAEGNVYPSILVFRGDRKVVDFDEPLESGEVLTVIPAVEGG